jgi:hypothetical protein
MTDSERVEPAAASEAFEGRRGSVLALPITRAVVPGGFPRCGRRVLRPMAALLSPPQAALMEHWSTETLANVERWSNRALVRERLRLFEELPRTHPQRCCWRRTCTHATSFVRSGSRWLVIGPEAVRRLLAERYERGSVMISSNLPFSKWGGYFQGRDDDGRSHRSSGALLRHPGTEHPELSRRASQESGQAFHGPAFQGSGTTPAFLKPALGISTSPASPLPTWTGQLTS